MITAKLHSAVPRPIAIFTATREIYPKSHSYPCYYTYMFAYITIMIYCLVSGYPLRYFELTSMHAPSSMSHPGQFNSGTQNQSFQLNTPAEYFTTPPTSLLIINYPAMPFSVNSPAQQFSVGYPTQLRAYQYPLPKSNDQIVDVPQRMPLTKLRITRKIYTHHSTIAITQSRAPSSNNGVMLGHTSERRKAVVGVHSSASA